MTALPLRVGQVLACSQGHPVWQVTAGNVGQVPADLDEVCLFCGGGAWTRAEWGLLEFSARLAR